MSLSLLALAMEDLEAEVQALLEYSRDHPMSGAHAQCGQFTQDEIERWFIKHGYEINTNLSQLIHDLFPRAGTRGYFDTTKRKPSV